MAQPSSNVAIAERLEALRNDVIEIKVTCKETNGSLQGFIKDSIAAHTRYDVVIEDHNKRITQNAEELQALRKAIGPLVFIGKILGVVGTLLAGSIVALIWSLITQQVTIVFP